MEFEGIGPVLFERSLRARNVSITVHQDSSVRVAVPRGVSFERARAVVVRKRGWIASHQERLRALRAQLPSIPDHEPMPRNEAAALLRHRLDELARRHGFAYNKVQFRRQKTRWGSCSGRNNISLNLRLVSLPQDLVDYVLLHELVHTRIKNHSPLFWRELARYVDGLDEKRRRLRRYLIA